MTSNCASIRPSTPDGTTDVSTIERATIAKVLRETRWNKSQAAKRLGLSRTQLYVRLVSTASKIRACYQRNKARDIHDLGVFAVRPLDEPLVRRLVALKLWQAGDSFHSDPPDGEVRGRQ